MINHCVASNVSMRSLLSFAVNSKFSCNFLKVSGDCTKNPHPLDMSTKCCASCISWLTFIMLCSYSNLQSSHHTLPGNWVLMLHSSRYKGRQASFWMFFPDKVNKQSVEQTFSSLIQQAHMHPSTSRKTCLSMQLICCQMLWDPHKEENVHAIYYTCFTQKKIKRGEGENLWGNSAIENASQDTWAGLEVFQVLNLCNFKWN